LALTHHAAAPLGHLHERSTRSTRTGEITSPRRRGRPPS